MRSCTHGQQTWHYLTASCSVSSWTTLARQPHAQFVVGKVAVNINSALDIPGQGAVPLQAEEAGRRCRQDTDCERGQQRCSINRDTRSSSGMDHNLPVRSFGVTQGTLYSFNKHHANTHESDLMDAVRGVSLQSQAVSQASGTQ